MTRGKFFSEALMATILSEKEVQKMKDELLDHEQDLSEWGIYETVRILFQNTLKFMVFHELRSMNCLDEMLKEYGCNDGNHFDASIFDVLEVETNHSEQEEKE